MTNDREFLYQLAVMYYNERLTQQEISQRLGISRPQVSRALSKAEQEGIVRVQILRPASEKHDLESRLAKLLGLRRVFIASQMMKNGSERERRSQDIAIAAANILPEIFSGKKFVGIGWGDTIYRTALEIDYSETASETCYVPLIGSLGMRERRYQVNSIVDRFAEKMKGQVMYFNGPAFAIDAQIREKTVNQEPFSSLVEAWQNLDVAVIGLGVTADVPGFPVNEFKPEHVEKLKVSKAIGDILGQFFDRFGNRCESGAEKEYQGVKIEDLSSVSQVICLCGGTAKVPGIIAAAQKKYFNHLITDERTAVELTHVLEGTV